MGKLNDEFTRTLAAAQEEPHDEEDVLLFEIDCGPGSHYVGFHEESAFKTYVNGRHAGEGRKTLEIRWVRKSKTIYIDGDDAEDGLSIRCDGATNAIRLRDGASDDDNEREQHVFDVLKEEPERMERIARKLLEAVEYMRRPT